MKLKNIQITNFRCFDSLSIDLDEQLTVIVAENGSGKTAILDAIATGMGTLLTHLPQISGKDLKITDLKFSNKIAKPFMRITLETYDGIKWDRTRKRDNSVTTKKLIPNGIGTKRLLDFVDKNITDPFNNDQAFVMPVIIYYGTGRGVFVPPKRSSPFKKEFQRFESLDMALEGTARFNDLFRWFDSTEDRERRGMVQWRDKDFWRKVGTDQSLPELRAVRKAIENMMPSFSKPRVDIRPWRFVIDWEKDGIKQTYRIEQLSDGYRMTLAMVMDIARRMAQANPDSENILESEAIVLIDEVDLHLHPKWQQTILPDLMRTFPNTQFIVTTHSPQVISTVAGHQIRILADNQVIAGEAGTQGAEASRILKDVFGVESRPQNLEIVKKLNSYLELIDKDEWDTKDALKLRQELDEWSQGHEPELIKADIDIRMKEFQRQL
ncbi:MAG: AAA family ATPase [Methylococcaceae bacterium]